MEQGKFRNLISTIESVFFMKGLICVNRYSKDPNLVENTKKKLIDQMKKYRMIPTRSGNKVNIIIF